jgi:hypothetical protein
MLYLLRWLRMMSKCFLLLIHRFYIYNERKYRRNIWKNGITGEGME